MDLSDHLATHTKITLGSSIPASHRTTGRLKGEKNELRLFNEANNLKFKQLIEEETGGEVTDEMDAQNSYSKFEEIYLKHYDDAYPLKSTHIRRKNERENAKPWIMPWLEDACQRKNRLYHLYVKEPSPEN